MIHFPMIWFNGVTCDLVLNPEFWLLVVKDWES